MSAYIRSDQQDMVSPTDFYEFFSGSFTVSNRNGTSKGKFSITGGTIELVHSDGKIEVSKISITPNAIMFETDGRSVTYVLATRERLAAIEAHKAEEARRSAGFIALSESSMNWRDAVVYCQQQGGRFL